MKAYMIVTNDEYEFPVAHDVFGKKAVAEYLGITMDCLNSCILRDHWSKNHKYKAVFDEEATKILQRNHKKEMDKHWKEYHRIYDKKYKANKKEGVTHGKTN